MKKALFGLLTAGLALGAAACSQNAFGTVAVTKDASTVSGCEKVADLTAEPGRFDDSSAQTQLMRAAQTKGANTLLIASDAADKGTAYRCSMPSVAGTARPGNTGSR